jgi:ADP-heptose:LPS heptosyltransferase
MMFFKKKSIIIPKNKVKKLLLVRPDALGDMVLMIPFLKALRKKYPQAHITVLASKYNSKVINHLDYIDEIIYKTYIHSLKDFFKSVAFFKSQSYDVALHFGIRDYIVWPCFFAVPINIGDKALLSLWIVFRKYGVFYRTHDRPKHVCEYYFIIAKALGLTLDDVEDLSMAPPPGSVDTATEILKSLGVTFSRPLVGIHVGVGFGNRPIKPEKYASYINALREKKEVDVCLSGYSDAEFQACSLIQSLVKEPVVVMPKGPLEIFMGGISLYDVFVSVDTGPFHIGAALGIPQLAIFPSKKVKPLSWGPFRNRHFVVRENGGCDYDCPHQGCPYDICSDDIREFDMVDKTERLLNGDGVATRKDQVNHWFSACMNSLILYDDRTEKEKDELLERLKSWGLTTVALQLNDPSLFETIRKNDIAIINNLTGKKRVKLFILGQRVIKYIYHSPLVIYGLIAYKSKDDLIEYYSKQFSKKVF